MYCSVQRTFYHGMGLGLDIYSWSSLQEQIVLLFFPVEIQYLYFKCCGWCKVKTGQNGLEKNNKIILESLPLNN